MKMFGSAGNDGKMPLMVSSQDEKIGEFGKEKQNSSLKSKLRTG